MKIKVHPLRALPVRVYRCDEAPEGRRFRAFLGSGKACCVFFDAADLNSARRRAEDWRAEQLAKSETAFLSRQMGLEKARAARAKKAAAKADAETVDT